MRPRGSSIVGDLPADEFSKIVAVCDVFESRLRAGERPRIADVIADNPALCRPALLFELLTTELEQSGDPTWRPSADEYRALYPDCLPAIDAAFSQALDRTEAIPKLGPTRPDHPAKIGRYSVVSLLDEGGQGQVFRVIHPGLGKELVLKRTIRTLPGDSAARAALAAEGRLLAGLDHPNLVRAVDADVDDQGCPFLVMEYIPGRSLDRHFESSQPTPRGAAALVAKLARAASYVHARGVVHQDIKPRNVLIDESGRPRLIDFGLAQLRHAWADGTSGPSGGTPSFMAPEQARGESDRIGPAADVYGLGAVLFFLLTGKSPIGGGDRAEVLRRARGGLIDEAALLESAAPARLRRICRKALSAEPTARQANAKELADQLERFAAEGRRRLVIASLIVVPLALALATWFLVRSSRPGPVAVAASRGQTLIRVLGRDRVRDLREAIPLHDGDQLWITCEIPRGTRPSVFWLDTEGVVAEFSPEITPGETSDTIRYPASGPKDVVGLQGPPGTEFVLVVVGRGSAVTRLEIEALLGVDRRLPKLPDGLLLRIDSTAIEPVAAVGTRSIGAPTEGTLAPLIDPYRPLQRGLRDRASFFEGVAFPHVARSTD